MRRVRIEVRDVSKAFGGVQAVRHCTLTVEPGTVTGLIGPNGAGKSTLFDIVAGFTRPDAGRVLLDGRDVTDLPPHRRFHLGLVRTFQIPRVFARMTVEENLRLVPPRQPGEKLFVSWLAWPRVVRREREIAARAAEVLELLGLLHLRDELAGHLSGGQKKLLEFGRVLMSPCRTVLLDEPGAGVNRTLLGRLAALIERLAREEGYTFCVVEHDMDLVARLCDPVIVMAEGTVLARGSFDEVRRDRRVLEAYLGGTLGAEAEP